MSFPPNIKHGGFNGDIYMINSFLTPFLSLLFCSNGAMSSFCAEEESNDAQREQPKNLKQKS